MAYTFTRTGAQIEEIHNTVDDPKNNTQFSDDIRTIAGEYRGLWPDTGGSANKGDTYQTQVGGTGTGQYFAALQNTNEDPVGDDVNWRSVVSYTSLQAYESASVADMIAGISQFGPITLAIKQRWSSGGTRWEVTDETGPITEANFRAFNAINVLDFDGVTGAEEDDQTAGLESAFAALKEFSTLFFPSGVYSTTRQIGTTLSHIQIQGDDKYNAIIRPHSSGFTSGTALVYLGDGVSTARTRVTKIAISAAYGSLGNDLDGLAIDSFFNADIEDCRLQSGNYITRETGGLRLVNGRHTRVHNNQLHNGFCHGLVVDKHLAGLNITGNAFDETSCGIRTLGNVLDMSINGSNEFGSAIRNSFNPAPVDRRIVDLTVGSHGTVVISGNLLGGGSETEFGIRYGLVDNITITANKLGGCRRFAICGEGPARNVVISSNAFVGNGADATDLDPANGLRNPDTTTFCSDVYLNSAFVYPLNFVGNSSTLDDRAIAWIEGTSNSFGTSGFSCAINNSRFSDIAYIHSRIISNTDVVQDATLALKGLAPADGVITARTVTRGSPQIGSISVQGVDSGDVVTACVKSFGGLDYNLVLSVEVQATNLVRWSLINTSDTPVAISDTDILITATKL